MGQYKLFNQLINFSDAEERLYDIYFESIQAAKEATTEFYKWYYGCGDILTVLKSYKQIASSLVVKHANQPLFEELTSLEIYDVSEDRYDDKCLILEEIYSAFNEIAEKYDDIVAEQAAAEEYRAERKASRGRVVGGGFGVGGAIKGMATAGAMNAVSGMGHSIANAIGNASSAATAASDKKALYKNDDTCIVLAKAIHLDIISCYFAHVDFINTLKEDYYVDSFNLDRSGALLESAKKVEHKRVELLTESFVNHPWNEELFAFVFKTYKEERKNIWDIAERFHIDLSQVAEESFAETYELKGKTSEEAACKVKKDILSQMKALGIKNSATIDNIEQDGVKRILNKYSVSEPSKRLAMFEKLRSYDASDSNKAKVIYQMGVWEVSNEYAVYFSDQEIENIINKCYDDNAKKSDQEALIAKAQIKQIMNTLNVKESNTFDTLEKDCLERLCGNVSNADEAACNKILSEIEAYDALEKNKQNFIQRIKTRIEEIWSAEDGEIFDNLYMNTNIYDAEDIKRSIEYIKQKGRTESSQKYIAALSKCDNDTIKKAFKYKSKYAKIILGMGFFFAAFALIAIFIELGIVAVLASLVLSVACFVHYYSLVSAWNLLTLNGTVIHDAFSKKREEQVASTPWTCNCGTTNKGNFCSKCGTPKNK